MTPAGRHPSPAKRCRRVGRHRAEGRRAGIGSTSRRRQAHRALRRAGRRNRRFCRTQGGCGRTPGAGRPSHSSWTAELSMFHAGHLREIPAETSLPEQSGCLYLRMIAPTAVNTNFRTAMDRAGLDKRIADLDAFNYTVAHELRGPLLAIQGFARGIEFHEAANLSPTGLARLQKVI